MSDPRHLTPRDSDEVARALSAALATAPDDDVHPGLDQLTALVNGALHDADREWILAHVELCRICQEDMADLAEVRASLGAGDVAVFTARPATWLKPAMGIAALAAGLTLVVWLGGRETAPEPPTPDQIAAAPVAPSIPAPVPPAPPPASATADEQALVARALATGRLEVPANAALLRGRTGTLLSPSTATATRLTPTTPVATAVVDPRPRFAWSALPNATAYTVAIFDDQFTQVAASDRLTAQSWTPATDLPRGRVLAWQITAHTPDGDIVSPAPPQPEARFTILSIDQAAALQSQRERLANDPLTLGLVLARAGLFDDAKAALTRALADPRYSADAVRPLLQQVR